MSIFAFHARSPISSSFWQSKNGHLWWNWKSWSSEIFKALLYSSSVILISSKISDIDFKFTKVSFDQSWKFTLAGLRWLLM